MSLFTVCRCVGGYLPKQLSTSLTWIRLKHRISAHDDTSAALYELIQKADATGLENLLQNKDVNVNVKDRNGWTPLMHAAKEGNTGIVKLILKNRCDVALRNRSGHTSEDIALFWNQREIAELIKTPNTTTNIPSHSEEPLFFCDNSLHSAEHLRKDKDWLRHALLSDQTKLLLFHKLRPLCKKHGSRGNKTRLFTPSPSQLKWKINDSIGYVFLGLSEQKEVIGDDVGEIEGAWFAADLSDRSVDEITEVDTDLILLDPMPGFLFLDNREASIMGKARTLLDWHQRYRFCATCGATSQPSDGGHRRSCSNIKCSTHRGIHNTCYPRVDPTVICLVVHPDREHCLLGRQPRFPPGMWSCLAGFIEPGESMEVACRREVYEEAGVHVRAVQYHSSQPWPMPGSLMLGCIAHAETERIKIDEAELADASWFSRKDLVAMVTQSHREGWFTPPTQAIAHQLIKHWLRDTAA